jgi:hypothetical protein
MSVVVAAREEQRRYWREDAGLVSTEIVRGNKVQCLTGLRLVFIVPVWAIPLAAVDYLFRGQAKQE